jgi:uncharacterized membrane protein YeiH
MVLAFATALGGGIIRDLLIGDLPPNSIRDWRRALPWFPFSYPEILGMR